MPFFDLKQDSTHPASLDLTPDDKYILFVYDILNAPDYNAQVKPYLELKNALSDQAKQDYEPIDKIVKAFIYAWSGDMENSISNLSDIVKNIDKKSLLYKGNNNIYAKINLFLSDCYMQMGNPIYKSNYFKEAQRVYKEEDNYEGLAACQLLQANYYNKQNDIYTEIRYLLEAVKYLRFNNNKDAVIQTQLKIATCYSIQHNRDEWEKYIELVLDKINMAEAAPTIKAEVYKSIGTGYLHFDMIEEAIEALRNSVIYFRQTSKNKDLYDTYKVLERCYIKNNLSKEIHACSKHLAIIESELYKKEQQENIQKQETIQLLRIDDAIIQTHNTYKETIRVMNEKLILCNEDKSRMITLLSHDLKEPIRGITSFVSLLDKSLSAKENENSAEIEYLNFIKKNANTMAAHIENLLKYIQLDEADTEIEFVDLNELVREVKTELMKKQKDKSVILSYSKLPVIKANKAKLNLLFYNLIDNAVKFNHNSPMVKIEYKNTGNKNEIVVSDNGIGIENENKEKVFELFRKANKIDNYDGWGVGLSISRKIVQQLGGDIQMDNNTNGGTRVRFTIAPNLISIN